jgi:hypothetical protein
MSADDDDIDPDDFVDNYYNEIIRRRAIAQRTDWTILFCAALALFFLLFIF